MQASNRLSSPRSSFNVLLRQSSVQKRFYNGSRNTLLSTGFSSRPTASTSTATATATSTTTTNFTRLPHINPQFPVNLSCAMVHTNKLTYAKSPYLIQHAQDPVEWYEWGDLAFERAKSENKPIFLSVGYSACHWCHVMQHEVFQNEDIAKYMNEHFVNIKVDREERPDVDRIYMTFLTLTNQGRGGWPLSAFLTPSLEPVVAGTYLPPPNFQNLCEKIHTFWTEEPGRLEKSASSMFDQLRQIITQKPQPTSESIDVNDLSKQLFQHWSDAFDTEYGGFGPAPKFPSPALTFNPLLRYSYYTADKDSAEQARIMVSFTLRRIMRGGIHDHVGQGFSRYSVDREWLTPHFEKMLYDQAQLLSSVLESALLSTKEEEQKELEAMAVDIYQYLERELQSPHGALLSAEDADSLPSFEDKEKKEGAFYVWTYDELKKALGDDAQVVATYFGAKEGGNVPANVDIQGELQNKNILSIQETVSDLSLRFNKSAQEIEDIISKSLGKLKQYRDTNRPRPHLDDKIVTGWNGLALSGLAKLIEYPLPVDQVTSQGAEQMARRMVKFLRENVWDGTELSRSWREGKGPRGQCEDYAFFIQGLLDLYESLGEEDYLKLAKQLQQAQDRLFWDEEDGAYFASPKGDQSIIVRMKEIQDGAEPSANSVNISNLYRLSQFFMDNEKEYSEKAKRLIDYVGETMLKGSPHGAGTALYGAKFKDGMRQLIVIGDFNDPATIALENVIVNNFIPNRVLISINPKNPPRYLAESNSVIKSIIKELDSASAADKLKPNVRICENATCQSPIYDAEELAKELNIE